MEWLVLCAVVCGLFIAGGHVFGQALAARFNWLASAVSELPATTTQREKPWDRQSSNASRGETRASTAPPDPGIDDGMRASVANAAETLADATPPAERGTGVGIQIIGQFAGFAGHAGYTAFDGTVGALWRTLSEDIPRAWADPEAAVKQAVEGVGDSLKGGAQVVGALYEDPAAAPRHVANAVLGPNVRELWGDGKYGPAMGEFVGELVNPWAKLATLRRALRLPQHTPGHGDDDLPMRRTHGDDRKCTGGTCSDSDGECFVAGTLVDTEAGPKVIEQARLGDRVGPPSALCVATDFGSWRYVQLRMLSDKGTEVDLELLRPSSWLERTDLKEGSYTKLRLEELALVGTAFVLRVGPGRSVAAGDRCPVTALIRHSAAKVISIRLDSGAPLEVTSEHPLFSASRTDWVAAGDLAVGELLQTRDGALRVIDVDRTPRAPEAVFNLEVFDQHEYFVGEQGIRAHNACADTPRYRAATPAGQRVNMPSWRKISINMDEVRSGHMANGKRLSPGNKKDVFPIGMTDKQVERAVRRAYRNGEVLSSQRGGERVFVRGPFGQGSIEMWVNIKAKMIETAWPKL